MRMKVGRPSPEVRLLLLLLLAAALNFSVFLELVAPTTILLLFLQRAPIWNSQCAVVLAATLTASPTRIAAALSFPPFVPTPKDDLVAVLDALGMPTSTRGAFIELGAGDGRNLLLAVQELGFASAVGVEHNPLLSVASQLRAWMAGEASRVDIVRDDLLAADLPRPAPPSPHHHSVVYLYLSDRLNRVLAPRLACAYHSEGDGPRIIVLSRDFELPGWGAPEQLLERGRTILRAYRVPDTKVQSCPAVRLRKNIRSYPQSQR